MLVGALNGSGSSLVAPVPLPFPFVLAGLRRFDLGHLALNSLRLLRNGPDKHGLLSEALRRRRRHDGDQAANGVDLSPLVRAVLRHQRIPVSRTELGMQQLVHDGVSQQRGILPRNLPLELAGLHARLDIAAAGAVDRLGRQGANHR
ncbi:hypothetical protein D3C81_1500140 [compost metagenome]